MLKLTVCSDLLRDVSDSNVNDLLISTVLISQLFINVVIHLRICPIYPGLLVT